MQITVEHNLIRFQMWMSFSVWNICFQEFHSKHERQRVQKIPKCMWNIVSVDCWLGKGVKFYDNLSFSLILVSSKLKLLSTNSVIPESQFSAVTFDSKQVTRDREHWNALRMIDQFPLSIFIPEGSFRMPGVLQLSVSHPAPGQILFHITNLISS